MEWLQQIGLRSKNCETRSDALNILPLHNLKCHALLQTGIHALNILCCSFSLGKWDFFTESKQRFPIFACGGKAAHVWVVCVFWPLEEKALVLGLCSGFQFQCHVFTAFVHKHPSPNFYFSWPLKKRLSKHRNMSKAAGWIIITIFALSSIMVSWWKTEEFSFPSASCWLHVALFKPQFIHIFALMTN